MVYYENVLKVQWHNFVPLKNHFGRFLHNFAWYFAFYLQHDNFSRKVHATQYVITVRERHSVSILPPNENIELLNTPKMVPITLIEI